ncbi:fructosamine kinase family protein [Halobacillus seohaensis]|uniref:Fructosamine kinase family protein n=1 Tax=Halobacillus seohaensis TaxID=447421 RepID=A0ABW2EN75_9BACI
MKQEIERVLRKMNDLSTIEEIRQVVGGDINEAFYVRTKEEQYFIKGNSGVPSHFFKAESSGLQLIRDSHTISVPRVYYYDEPQQGEIGMLAMEWIDGQEKTHTQEKLGRNLALMHQQISDRYGFSDPTFVGELDQPNDWRDSWLDYYQDFRLNHQFNIALEKGRLPEKRKIRLEKLILNLEQWIPSSPAPSLLHGDLWGGNFIAGLEGEPFLVDPSIVYGDSAFELAFTELFGGFQSSFYEAYEEISPLPKTYEEMKPLYQLFYLLVHLNIFGESYGPPVDRILKRYVG